MNCINCIFCKNLNTPTVKNIRASCKKQGYIIDMSGSICEYYKEKR